MSFSRFRYVWKLKKKKTCNSIVPDNLRTPRLNPISLDGIIRRYLWRGAHRAYNTHRLRKPLGFGNLQFFFYFCFGCIFKTTSQRSAGTTARKIGTSGQEGEIPFRAVCHNCVSGYKFKRRVPWSYVYMQYCRRVLPAPHCCSESDIRRAPGTSEVQKDFGCFGNKTHTALRCTLGVHVIKRITISYGRNT